MRIAIIGSRHRQDRLTVEQFVAGLPPDTTVVSGGCRGVDTWAEQAARRRGLPVAVHRPDLTGTRCHGEIARRYHARNQDVVDDADRVVALVAPDRRGGTEDTIRRAQRAGKGVTIL